MDLPKTARAAVVAEYQFWKALEFVRRTASRYDFEAMLTTRYPLDRINDAIQSMRAFREIKPLVLPWAER